MDRRSLIAALVLAPLASCAPPHAFASATVTNLDGSPVERGPDGLIHATASIIRRGVV